MIFEPNPGPAKSDINVYFDIISPYAYLAFTVTQHYAPIWRAQGYAVRYIPVFQGGIMQGSGNSPPMSVPAKGAMSTKDSQRWAKVLGIKLRQPEKFPVNSIHCARVLAVINRYHAAKMASAMQALWIGYWGSEQGGFDISSFDNLKIMLSRVFTGSELDIMFRMSKSDYYKSVVKENTRKALAGGAFGVPWIEVVKGDTGDSETFFGNDRWIHVCDYAGISWDGYAVVGGGERAMI